MGTPATKAKPATGAQSIRANAQAAQNCSLGANGNCAFCQRQGVPILPLRYAVIPKFLKGRPDDILAAAPTVGSRLKDKTLAHHKYTVRTLRKGFVHVYLGKPGAWQVYAVTEAGHLRLLPNPDDPDAKTDRSLTPQCTSQGHNIPASFINIPTRYVKGTIWVAFANDLWNAQVRGRYEAAPSKRMQAFDCAALAKNPAAQVDAMEVTPDALALGRVVEEYSFTAADQQARHSYAGSETVDTNRNNRFDDVKASWHSVHGIAWRTGQLEPLAALATRRQAQTQGKEKLAAIVLDDPVGIVQELNCMRLRHVNFQAEYSASVLRPQMVSQAILGLKSVVENSAVAARTKSETAKGQPDVQTHYVPGVAPYPGVVVSSGYSYKDTRAERAAIDAKTAWTRLAKRYDEGKRSAFDTQFKQRMAQYDGWIRGYDADYAVWAGEPQWVKWVKDYDVKTADGCAGLVQMCAPCLAGGPVTEPTMRLWKTWLDTKKPGDADNPVYLALLAGQKELIDFLLPDGINAFPSDSAKKADPVDKGDNTYDAIKALAGSDEWRKLLAKPFLSDVAQVQLALGGAVSKLGDQLTRQGEAIALRAQQSALKMYRDIDVTILTVEMKLADYHKFLSEIAFKKLHSEVDNLFTQGSKTVKSIAIAGVIAIGDPKLADTIVRVTLWTLDKAENVRKALQAAIGDVRLVANAGAAATGATLRFARHALTLGHTTAQAIGTLAGTARLNSAQMARFAKTIGQSTGKVLRVAGSADSVLAAGAVFFQAWSFRDGIREMESKFGKKRTEALVGVVADGMGVVTGAAEIAGIAMKSGLLGRGLTGVGAKVLVGGGLLAAAASAVEGVQALMGAHRTFGAGDNDAGKAYLVSGALFLIGGFFAGAATLSGSTALLGSMLVLGPLGLAILLLVGAVVALWWAINAEDTAAEIWLDRCYFGHGERSEGRWTDKQVNEELAELNAVLLGTRAEVEWEDKLGMDRVGIKLTMPGFNENKSAFEYTVSALHRSGSWIPVVGGRHNLPAPPTYVSAWDGKSRGPDLTKSFEFATSARRAAFESDDDGNKAYVVEDGFRIDEDDFSRTRIEFKYWYDLADSDAVSTITHTVVD